MGSVTPLFELATNVFVRHVNLLSSFTEYIPDVLFDSLLMASVKTERILSTRHLFLNWPLQTISLVDCKVFKEADALILAHCLEAGTCTRLSEVDLSGCNIGVKGTTALLKLAVGQPPYPKAIHYGTNGKHKDITTLMPKGLPKRLSITSDCYVTRDNYVLLSFVVQDSQFKPIHDFNVSCFNAIDLGFICIWKVMEKLSKKKATKSVTGFNLEMNTWISSTPHDMTTVSNFSNLRYLNLSRTLMSFNDIALLLRNITSTLTHLLLNSCLGSPRCLVLNLFDLMAKLPCTCKLEHFEMANINIARYGPDIVKFLQKCSGTLTFLNLENSLRDKSAVISQLLDPPFQLKTLRIADNRFSLDAERMLFRKDKFCCIKGYQHSKTLLEK